MDEGGPEQQPQAGDPEASEGETKPAAENVAPESTDEESKIDEITEPTQPLTEGGDNPAVTEPVEDGAEVPAEVNPDGPSQEVGDGGGQTTQAGQEEVEQQVNKGDDPAAGGESINETDKTPEGETPSEVEVKEGVAEDGTTPQEGEPGATDGEPGTIEGEQGELGATDEAGEAPTEESTAKEEGGEEGELSSPIPDSGTFQDGERPETPTVQVPEPLSREGSPKQEPEHIDAGTPEAEESPRAGDAMEDVNEEEEPLFSREELMEAYQAALAERDQLHNHNTQLQHKLAEYFKKKKSDDQRQEMDKNVTDQEQRYLKYMSNLEELRNQEADERESFHYQLEELKERKQERLELVKQEHDHFTDLKRTVASEAISSRTGKPLMPREVEMYISNELKKEDEVKVVRLENIKLKNRLKKREQQLKAKEELAEGLHLIDFEQLKIENQTYNEKIEERNEELLKFRKKITSTVQVLTHVKEKLQFVQAENQVQKIALREVEAHVALKRDLLSRTKKARDSLRIDNQRLRQRCGLLGNEALLRDFEERKDEGEELRSKLDRLKQQHAELILKTAGVKKKIDETRS